MVNCTGTSTVAAPGTDPLFDDLLTAAGRGLLGRPSTAGMGLRTRGGPARRLGRLDRGADLDPRLGAARRAVGVHRDPRDPHPGGPGRGLRPRRGRPVAPAAGRRPARRRSPPGRPAARPARAAAVDHCRGRRGVQRRARAPDAAAVGADEKLHEAVALDPGFAVAHAALAMLGHEAGARRRARRRWTRPARPPVNPRRRPRAQPGRRRRPAGRGRPQLRAPLR